MMIEREQLFARDQIRLHLQWASPSPAVDASVPAPASVSATVVITHGLGEHCGRYGHVVEALTAHGAEVLRYDLRGHGRSTGRRGDAPGFGALLDDLKSVVAAAKQRQSLRHNGPPPPIFLYGHSLGGLITLRFLQEQAMDGISNAESGIAGAIVASPWLRLAFQPSRWKIFLASVMRRICPGFRQITGMDTSRLSRDAAFLQTLPDLDLSHHRLSARLFYEIERACVLARARASKITLPLLLLHGQADPVTCWMATRDFYEAAASADKTLKLYPEALHETHNDLDRNRVVTDIAQWVTRHTAFAKPG